MKIQHPLLVTIVLEPSVVLVLRDERPHLLCSSLDIGHIFIPERTARVTLLAGWERRVVPGGALITENTGDAHPTVALSGFRVTSWTLSTVQVTVTS